MASQFSKTLVVERKQAVMVRPSGPSPPGLLPLSTIDNDPNMDLICQAVHVYGAEGEDPAADGESWCSDPATAIREGLSRALVYYYPLAGRLQRDGVDGKLQVDCTGEGVLFSPATASCTLASIDHLNGDDEETAQQLVFQPAPAGEACGGHPLVVMQVTRFACGGFTVGLGLSHSVCDGFGMAQFLRAVAELAGGQREPSVKPVWDRGRLVAPAPAPELKIPDELELDPPAASPHLPSSDLVHRCFDVDSGSIKSLKRALQEEFDGSSHGSGGGGSFTTMEALGAFVWRSRFRALEMNPDGKTHFCLTVGIRNAMDPPLPEGYYGNAFVGAHVIMAGRDLCEGPLSGVAADIREKKRAAMAGEYVGAYVGILERANQERWTVVTGLGASLVVTDWRHMGLAGASFGGRRAVNVVALPWDMFGYVDLCIFMPPSRVDAAMEGGVRVRVCLPKAAMARFQGEMASLRQTRQQDVACLVSDLRGDLEVVRSTPIVDTPAPQLPTKKKKKKSLYGKLR